MKPRIVIIGANDFQNKLIVKAKEEGYETHVFAWKVGDIGEAEADFFYPISIIEKEKILEVCKRIRPIAICSIGSDLAVITVNYLSRRLGLVSNSELCDSVATNKFEMRNAFKRNGIYTPEFYKVCNYDIKKFIYSKKLKYPVIVKPTDRSGSRGITKIESKNGLEEAIELAIDKSFENAAIVEEFIDGKEYSCESISFEGKHHILGITEKYTTGTPNFIEIGHIEPAQIKEEVFCEIEKEVIKALEALNFENGAAHSEFKIDDNGKIRIIEIGARMGGDYIGSDLVFFSTGNDYMKMVIDVSCGKKPEIKKSNCKNVAAVRFIVKPEDLQLLNRKSKAYKIMEISDMTINEICDVKDSASRLGYFIVIGEKYDDIRKELFM